MTWFSRLRNWTTDASNGIGIRADYHDSEDNNFATGINASLNIAGLNSPTADIPWGTNKITGLKTGTLATDAANVSQVQTRLVSYAVDNGATNTYTIALSPALTSYVNGQSFYFQVGSANTAAATLNINGVGAISIKKDYNVALASGDLAMGKIIQVAYDGTNFQLITPVQGLMGQSMTPIYAADAGASSAYAITLSPALSAYNTGQMINFKANTACSGGATLNVNALGAKTIVKDKAAAVADNDILAGQDVQVIYDGTNFQMLSPIAGCVGQNGQSIYALDTGSANTYVITLSPVPNAYKTGMVVNFKAASATSGSATLNVNALGAITIKKYGATNLATGDIANGQLVQVAYDGTNFQMLSPIATTGVGSVTSVATGAGLTGGTITSSGTVSVAAGVPVQIKSTTLTTRFTTTSTSFTDLTGLSVAITPGVNTNKVLVSGHITFGEGTSSDMTAFQIVRGATPIGIGTSGTGLQTNATGWNYNVTAISQVSVAFNFLDSPATTSSTTYKIQILSPNATTSVVNGTGNNANHIYEGGATSTITVMEITA